MSDLSEEQKFVARARRAHLAKARGLMLRMAALGGAMGASDGMCADMLRVEAPLNLKEVRAEFAYLEDKGLATVERKTEIDPQRIFISALGRDVLERVTGSVDGVTIPPAG